MKGYSLLFTLCISSLAVCNDQLFFQAPDEPGSTSYSVELKQNSVFHGRRGLSGHDIVRNDRARADFLLRNKPQEVPFMNTPAGAATIDVQVGNGFYTLLVDTGSSNTWVGANTSNPYRPSKLSRDTGQDVNVTYGSGNFTGRQLIDTMELPGIPHKVIQSIGSAHTSAGFEGFDGILGIGPDILTNGTLSPNVNEVVPTITGNLFKNHIIQHNMSALFVPPLAKNISGRADFGGINITGLTSEITFVPNTKIPVLNQFWAIDQSITFGEGRHEVKLVEGGHCLVDVGTTLMLLPTSSFNVYAKLVDAVMDNSTGLLRVDDSSKLRSMFFHIGEKQYEFTPDAQKWPSQFNVDAGGVENATYLIIGDVGVTNTPNTCINGWTWLQRKYAVFDGGNFAIGFADTKFTLAVVNN